LKGDYDGDHVDCIWQPDIVDAFHNADAYFADTPKDFETNHFFKDTEMVEDYLRRNPETVPPERRAKELQMKFIQLGLRDLPVGFYAK
jgi:hypothetical protein